MLRKILILIAATFVWACAEPEPVKYATDNNPPTETYELLGIDQIQDKWGDDVVESGTPVAVRGVVTAVAQDGSFWIQEPECGGLHGVYVDNQLGGSLVTKGATVEAHGTLQRDARTEIALEEVVVLDSGMTEIPAHWVHSSAFTGPSGGQFESMMVGIRRSNITDIRADGTIIVDDTFILDDSLDPLSVAIEKGGHIAAAVGVMHREDNGRFVLKTTGQEDIVYIAPADIPDPNTPPVVELPPKLTYEKVDLEGPRFIFNMPDIEVSQPIIYFSALCASNPVDTPDVETAELTFDGRTLSAPVPDGLDLAFEPNGPRTSGQVYLSVEKQTMLSLLWTKHGDANDPQTNMENIVNKVTDDFEMVYDDVTIGGGVKDGRTVATFDLSRSGEVVSRSVLVIEQQPDWDRAAMCWVDTRDPGVLASSWGMVSQACEQMTVK